jgi:hypothetical protein
MVERRVGTRLGILLGAIAIGALLGGCGGSDSSGASASGPVSIADNEVPVPDTSSTGHPFHGLRPWGPSSGNSPVGNSPSGSGSSSSSSGSSHATPGTVTISWQPPTENTNGTTLTDLAGYTIHYGTQSQNYTSAIEVTNPGLTSYVVENLPAGTYYFAVSAYTSSGEASSYSPQVSVTVD